MPLRPGERIGGYRIVRLLGTGGMGTVYLAEHPSLPRSNAIKVLSPELSTDPDFRARFEREANLAASLDHPNLISVFDRGEENGLLWIAMSYIDGTDAAEEVAKGPAVMTVARALRIVTEVGKGLDFAHQRGMLHRDVKPANFLLSGTDPAQERVVLTDFGVARSAQDTLQLTQTGKFVATIAYASPEQLLGRPLDHRSDIYALGCSLTKMLTGQDAYPSTIPANVMLGHLHEPPPRPSLIRPELPPAIDAVIARAMAKDPAARYNSCREFSSAAADALLPGALPVQQIFTPPPKRRRTGLVAAGAGLVAVLALAGTVIAVSSIGGESNSSVAAATTSTTAESSPTTDRSRTSTTRSTTRSTSSSLPPLTPTNPDCAEYQRIKPEIDAAIDTPAPDHGDRVVKYNQIADTISGAADATPEGEVKRLLTSSATNARALATRAGQPDATDDELEQLRLEFVDPWVALLFTCI